MEPKLYDVLETLEWNQLFNFGLDIKEPEKKGKKSKEA